jgi:hypothetical protein
MARPRLFAGEHFRAGGTQPPFSWSSPPGNEDFFVTPDMQIFERLLITIQHVYDMLSKI